MTNGGRWPSSGNTQMLSFDAEPIRPYRSSFPSATSAPPFHPVKMPEPDRSIRWVETGDERINFVVNGGRERELPAVGRPDGILAPINAPPRRPRSSVQPLDGAARHVEDREQRTSQRRMSGPAR